MFDLLIVGAGPGGLTAAIYAARNNMKVGIFEKDVPGGTMVVTATVENYPGFKKIDGPGLSYAMFEQTMNLGVEYFGFNVKEIRKEKDHFVVVGDEEVKAKSVIIASGTAHKKLNVPGEEKYSFKGISWCAICDGALYKGKEVAVIGGGNAAFEESIYLSNLASKVYLIHRREGFRAEGSIIDEVKRIKNIELVTNTVVKEFVGAETLGKIRLLNLQTNEESDLEVSGCFEFVGQIPATDFAKKLGITTDTGFIKVDENCETKVKGLFACGDVLDKQVRQIVTAVSDGAIAALNAIKYCR